MASHAHREQTRVKVKTSVPHLENAQMADLVLPEQIHAAVVSASVPHLENAQMADLVLPEQIHAAVVSASVPHLAYVRMASHAHREQTRVNSFALQAK
jgi:hypothetical protein